MTSTNASNWELRNRGFVPPSQLRTSTTPVHEFSQPESSLMASTTLNSPASSTGSNHIRSSSFFSFRSKSSNPSSPPPTTPNKLTRHNSQLSPTWRSAGAGEVEPSLPDITPLSPYDGQLPLAEPPQPLLQPLLADSDQPQQKRPRADSDVQPLHPEIRSIVSLNMAHTQKIYFSGPLVRRLERTSDGKPSNDTGWTDVWVQLYGTTLSVWDMKEVKEANEQGKEVPPSYVNVTEAFIQVLGAVTQPSTPDSPAQTHSNVITLNTAGANLYLFSCPSTVDLISWAAALRLATWEKSRLEEMYTAHLIRITLNDGRTTPSPLIHGRMEGWVRVRIAGQVDWKRFWMVVTVPSQPPTPSDELGPVNSRDGKLSAPITARKNRMSTLFSRERSPERATRPVITLYASQKPKDKKTPQLSFVSVTQAFSVYPERPKLISTSTLIKLEGTYGQEEIAGPMKMRDAWLLFMPELEGARNPGGEMLKWLIGIHDAFELYGRPKAYSWDPRDSVSMMFAYPIGQHKDLLFLDREFAEALDPREDRTPVIRSNLLNIIIKRMRGIPVLMGPPPHIQPQPQVSPVTSGMSKGQEQPPHLPIQAQDPPIVRSVTNPDQTLKSPVVEENASILDKTVSTSPVSEIETTNPRKSIADSKFSYAFSLPSPGWLSPVDPAGTTTQNHADMWRLTTSPTLDQPPGTIPRSASQASPADPGMTLPTSPDLRRFTTSPPLGQSPRTIPRSESQTSPLSSSHPQDNATDHDRSPRVPQAESPIPLRLSVGTVPSSVVESNLPSPRNAQQRTTSPLPSSPPFSSLSPLKIISSREPSPPTAPKPLSPLSMRSPSDDITGALHYMIDMQEFNAPVARQTRRPSNSDSAESEDSDSTSKPSSRTPSPQPRKESISAQPVGILISEGKPAEPRDRDEPTQVNESSSQPSIANSEPKMADLEPEDVLHTQSYEHNLDALAALTFLETEEASKTEVDTNLSPSSAPVSSINALSPHQEGVSEDGVDAQYKSSFAPSKKAAERLAKTQAQQAAYQAAVHKPGRSNGRSHTKSQGAWGDSSEDEEEEEGEEEDDDDDDDVDSDGEPTNPPTRAGGSDQASVSGGPMSGNGRQPSSYEPVADFDGPQQRAPAPRHMQQMPIGPNYGSQEGYYQGNSPSRRNAPNQYFDTGRSLYSEDGFRRPSPQPPIRSQAEYPTPGAAHHSMWSQVLEPDRAPPPPERDTFVQLEPPSQTMTKAFTPHGLLSAGLQDKQGRSAKRQEEVAKETGASLVNVPAKPPPPQTGLLGAVSAHERERKREGGIGAALTERERDRRLAEERQRKLDEFQRQQLEMAQTGSMYGGPGHQFGYNPMMMNPMMMGMNPMMAGWGYPAMNPMMAGFGGNPQQMFAAQQAAQQAYQQAMMAFANGQGGSPPDMSGMQGMQPLNPMMTGGGMFDPRMSMMSMPMMGQMGMGGAMGGGMGSMGMGNGMAPLTTQMTGSGFDPRFSTASSQFDLLGAAQPQRPNSSSQGSPSGNLRSFEPDHPVRSSANASPSPLSKSLI